MTSKPKSGKLDYSDPNRRFVHDATVLFSYARMLANACVCVQMEGMSYRCNEWKCEDTSLI